MKKKDDLEEILEFWDVSNCLMTKPRDKGENVAEEFGLNIWCRMTRGRDIYMDDVIQEIAKDILTKSKR